VASLLGADHFDKHQTCHASFAVQSKFLTKCSIINVMKEQKAVSGNIFKWLWLIPILLLGYIGWMNLVPFGGTVTYSIDAGGEDTTGEAKITDPLARISDKKKMGNTSFRELEKRMVYFELESRRLRDADEVIVRVRFKDEFPGDEKFFLGAKNQEEWSYYWQESYVPLYEQLTNLPLVAEAGSTRVYATGEKGMVDFQSVDDFLQYPPLGSVIARNDKSLNINQRVSPEETEISADTFATGGIPLVPSVGDAEQNSYLDTNTSLKGTHTFYFFASSNTVELKVFKQDLNWYEEPDELAIEVYTLDGELKGTTIIPDDGDEGKTWSWESIK